MKDQTICLAGGCFWGMEALYRRLPGVTDVVCGYANGDSAAHANYEDVCTGITGFRDLGPGGDLPGGDALRLFRGGGRGAAKPPGG